MKRRVLVAQALVHKPPVIVLDEPTAGVDVELRQTLWQFIARLNKQGHTVLLTTHYLEEAEALCGRIAMLKTGRVVALERTSELLKAASSNVLRFKIDSALPPRIRRQGPGHGPHRAAAGARRPRDRTATWPSSGRRACGWKTWRSARRTWRMCSWTSCPSMPTVAVSAPAAKPRRPLGSAVHEVTSVGAVPMTGWRTLFYKEVLRFWKVSFQTVAAPVLTAVLYLLIFGHVLQDHVKVYDQVSYTAFLVPGLVMMSVLQNAFANSSSSLIQSKIMGSLVFVLLTPLSHWSWFFAYVGSSIARGLAVGLGVFAVTALFAQPGFVAPLWILVFAVLGAAMLGALGLIAGLWAEKFDQMAAFQNFVIMPMTFLSGVFYSIHSLPAVLAAGEPPQPVLLHDRRLPLRLLRRQRRLALAQPGHRRPRATLVVSAIAVHLLRIGYKIRG